MSKHERQINQISWLKDQPIVKTNPKNRDPITGVIIPENTASVFSNNPSGTKAETISSPKNKVVFDLDNYGSVIVYQEDAYIKFQRGRTVDFPRNLCLTHAVFCSEPICKTDKQILEEVNGMQVDTASKLKECYPNLIKTATLKIYIVKLNSIYSTYAPELQIKSETLPSGERAYSIQKNRALATNILKDRGKNLSNQKTLERQKPPVKNEAFDLNEFGILNIFNVKNHSSLTLSGYQVIIEKNLAGIYLAFAKNSKGMTKEQTIEEVKKVRQELNTKLGENRNSTIKILSLKKYIQELNNLFCREALPLYISYNQITSLYRMHIIVPKKT